MPDASGSDPGRPDRPRNVFGEPLAECCAKPLTGFYRTGSCETGPEDFGVHTVCARVDADFPRVLESRRQRPLDPVSGRRLSRAEAGRLLVPVRGALEGGVRRGQGAEGAARRDARGDIGIVPLDLLKKYALDLS